MIRPRPAAAAWPALVLTLAGCGYAYGVDNFGPGARSIAVEVAENLSYRQNFETSLTRAIHTELAENTDLRQTTPDRADSILRITITSVDGQPLVRGGAPPLLEGALDFTAAVELIDRATGRPLRERTVLDRAEYRIPVGETLESATNEAVTDLARKIVLALEADF